MEVKFKQSVDEITFYLFGELDEHYSKGVKDYIEQVLTAYPARKKIVFNMSGLNFMDSTGIGMLLGRYKRLKKEGAEVYIECPTVAVEKVLELSGIYEVIPKL